MKTPPPSVYCYRSERDWEIEMALWCAENEPRDTSVKAFGVCYLDAHIRTWKWFYTDADRADWIASHPEFSVVRTEEQGRISVPAQTPGPAGCPDKLDGGSRADYRAAGFMRY